MRGLQLLETIDVHGSLTVTELARLTGMDKSAVSRMVSACEPDGWVVRDNGRISMGPRAALLGHSSPSAEFVRQSARVVETVAGVTGMQSQAYALVGSRVIIVASAGAGYGVPVGLGTSAPLFATAAGIVIAAQLSEAELDRLLPPDPFPDAIADMLRNPGFAAFASAAFSQDQRRAAHPEAIPANRHELNELLSRVRTTGVGYDHGDLHPELGCIAVAWQRPGINASLTCMASPAEIEQQETLALAALRAAAGPGATRENVVAAAAAASSARSKP